MANRIRVEVTRTTDAWPKGAELGFDNEADATRVLGDGAFKVVSLIDGSPYEKPAEPKKTDTKTDE